MSEEITLRLSSPSQPPGFFLGDDTDGSVWILSLAWRGAAHRAGVVPNSILCAVDGGSVRSAADAAARIRERAAGAASSGAVVLSVRAPAAECGYRGSLLTRAVTRVTREGKERLTLAVFEDVVALHRGRHDAARVLAVGDVAAVTSVVARGSLVVVVRVAGGEAGDELLFSQDADAPGNPPGDGEDIVGVVAGLMAMRQAGDGGGGGGGGSGSEAAGGSRTRTRSRRGSARSRRSDRTVEAPQPQPAAMPPAAPAALDVYDRHTQAVAEAHSPGELRLVNALRLPEDCEAVKSLVAKHVVYACVSCEVVGGGSGDAARLLLVTDRAVYELRPNGALVRCFAAAAVAEVLCCAATGHVAMRVPGQPDLLVRVTGASATATRVTEAVSLVSPCVPVRMLDYTPPAELAQKLFLEPPRSWRFTPDMMIAFTPRSIDPHEAAVHGTLGSHGLPPPPPPPHASRAHSPVRMRGGGGDAAAASDPPPPPPPPLPSRPTAAELELRGVVMELRNQLDAVSGEMQRMRRLSELERRSERDRTATSAAGAALADRRLAELEVASAVLGDAIVQQAAGASPPPPPLPPAQAPLPLSPYRLEPPLPLSGLSAGMSPLEPVVGYAAVAMREAAAAAASPALPGESRVLFQRVPPARTAAVGRYP